ncbi:uncharacterized protein LOC144425219 [Styela clava]
MLLPFSVYCRRIKATTSSTISVCFKTPNRPQIIFNFLLHLLILINNSVINFKRANIFLLFVALNLLFVPIMGSPLIVNPEDKSGLANKENPSITHNQVSTNDNFNLYESTTKKRDFERQTPLDFLQKEKNTNCLFCKIFSYHRKDSPNKVTHTGSSNSLQQKTAFSSESTTTGHLPTIQTNTAKSETTSSGKLRLMGAISHTAMDSFPFNKPRTRRRWRRNVGDRRLKRLYCRTGYILQIRSNGRVDGTYDHRSKLGEMLIQTVSKGLVRIQSRATGLFLAMTRSGKLYATEVYDPNRSNFVEKVEEGWYNTYSNWISPSDKRQRKSYVGISKHGKPKKGTRISYTSKSAHFLPLDVD